MHHGLLISALVVSEFQILLQRLSETSNVAVTKNSEATSKETLFAIISCDMLALQKLDQSLSRSQPLCIHPSYLMMNRIQNSIVTIGL